MTHCLKVPWLLDYCADEQRTQRTYWGVRGVKSTIHVILHRWYIVNASGPSGFRLKMNPPAYHHCCIHYSFVCLSVLLCFVLSAQDYKCVGFILGGVLADLDTLCVIFVASDHNVMGTHWLCLWPFIKHPPDSIAHSCSWKIARLWGCECFDSLHTNHKPHYLSIGTKNTQICCFLVWACWSWSLCYLF